MKLIRIPPNYSGFKILMSTIYVAIILSSFKAEAQDVPLLRIDPSKSAGGLVSDYFQEIEYIPLETTKESLFGQVGQLIVSEESIVICDPDTKSILFFTKKGKLINKIRYKDNITVWLSYDWTLKRVCVTMDNDITGKSVIQYYSNQGILIENSRLEVDANGEYGSIALGNGFFANFKSCYREMGIPANNKIYHLVNIYKDQKPYKSFLPYSQTANPGACSWGLGGVRATNIVQNKSIFISTPLNYEVYKINPDTALKVFQFVLPAKYSFDKRSLYINDEKFVDSMRNVLLRDPYKIVNISNITTTNKFILFKLNAALPSRGQIPVPLNLIYNFSNERLVALERLTPDSTNSYLPILDYDSFLFIIYGLIYDQKYFYTTVSSLKMFNSYSTNFSRRINYPVTLQKYFKTETRKSNPVIVKMKLKDF